MDPGPFFDVCYFAAVQVRHSLQSGNFTQNALILFLPPPLCVEFTAHKTTHRSVRVSVTQDDSLYVYVSVFVFLSACMAHIALCDLAHIHIKSLVDNV